MGAVSFSREGEELITRFSDRCGIPVGRKSPEQLAGGDVEDGDGIVVGFCNKQTLSIMGKCDGVGCAALGRGAWRGIMQIPRNLSQLRVDDGHTVATCERNVKCRSP